MRASIQDNSSLNQQATGLKDGLKQQVEENVVSLEVMLRIQNLTKKNLKK